MKKLRFAMLALAFALLGAFSLLTFMKLHPDAARSLLGSGVDRWENKSIDDSVPLTKSEKEEVAEENGQDQEDAFNPFAEAERIQQEMEKQMRAGQRGIFAFDSEMGQQVVTKEDANSVSYEIKGVDGKLNTEVKNGYLTISGETKKQAGNASIQSSFHRMFPLPPNVDSEKMETISEKDKVVLRFPKRKNS